MVQLSWGWYKMACVVHAFVHSRVGGVVVHSHTNQAAGARFCVLGVKRLWERADGVPIEVLTV